VERYTPVQKEITYKNAAGATGLEVQIVEKE
jgi:hypothetical protein